MILCVCLNPAVDQTCEMEGSFEAGAVNRLKTMHSFAGGKGVNVARFLRICGEETGLLAFAGGSGGSLIGECLRREGVIPVLIPTKEACRCNKNILSADGKVTEILEPGPYIEPGEWDEMWAAYRREIKKSRLVILSGSLPGGADPATYEIMITIAKQQGCTVFLDTAGEALSLGCRAVPDLIKPNPVELSALFQRPMTDKKEGIAMVRELMKDYALPGVILSLGKEGMLYFGKEGCFHANAPEVEAVNTVSCGDCVVASFASSFVRGLGIEGKLRLAAARSAACAAQMESGQYSESLAQELVKKVKITHFEHELDTI